MSRTAYATEWHSQLGTPAEEVAGGSGPDGEQTEAYSATAATIEVKGISTGPIGCGP